MKNQEKRLDIPGYEGIYQVSNVGIVYSGSRPLRGWVTKNGHRRVSLRKEGQTKSFYIHRLVALSFIGDIDETLEVCHNDGNGINNCLENLRIDTRSSNQLDRQKHGTDFYRNKRECPRGHGLAWPNLKPNQWKSGTRSCRACNRESARASKQKDGFRQENADWQYQRIMNGE